MSRFAQEVQDFMDSQKSQYETQLVEARASALAEWDAALPELEKESAKRVAETLLAYPENEREAVADRLYAGAARELARLKAERLEMACAMIEEPWSREQVEKHLSHLREPEPVAMAAMSASVTVQSIYRLADGRLYDITPGEFMAGLAPGDEEKVVELGGEPTNANLKESLIFYNLPVGDCLLTPEEVMARKRASIDGATSAAILGGFDYEINGELLHFSYDSFDQQNFADTANACLMRKAGAEGLPETINWNAYRHDGTLVRLTLTADEFLALYAGGALNHKAACMELGGVKKAELAANS